MSAIRVVVADDHDLFRRGLAEVLQDEQDVEVVAEAKDGKDAVEKAIETTPDVVFMDLNMPRQSGIEATAYIRQNLPNIKVLVLTVSEEPTDLFKALSVGALGYVLKTANPQEIIEALRQVHQGWVVVSPSMAPRFISEFERSDSSSDASSEIPDAGSQLTLREQEILRLVARGLSNAEIASELVVSENTVKTHVKNILSKLHSKNRSEAVAYASRLGFLRTP